MSRVLSSAVFGRGGPWPVWRRLSMMLVGVLTCSVVGAINAPASSAAQDGLPLAPQERIIEHTDVPLRHRSAASSPGGGVRAASSWPAAGDADVELPRDVVPEHSRRADLGAPTSGPRKAGDLPVTLTAGQQAAAGTGPTTVRVHVADRAAADSAGVSGVLLSFIPTEGTVTSTTVGVDYSSFRYAGGADFGSRLRLVALPACALTTPRVAACQVQTPLPSRNDAVAQMVSADVGMVAESGMVLAAVAGESGANGTFTASSLAPSGTWSVTGNSGGFTWSYPIALPPAATGAAVAPKVALSYGSSGVDGRTADTNNQPSWIGQGWDYTPGFIERTYRSCALDEGLPEPQKTRDLCWAGQIVTMSLGGQSVPLVYDDATRTWRASADNGARVELLTGAANSVHQGEHWKVTTPDGVQYYFGRNRGPGYTNQEQTNSAWTVPVYGPRNGDPCHNAAGFAQSSCAQAWRWNLDFVEDPHGNVTSYYYRSESNFYGANKGTAGVAYTRGGTLARIDYGLRKINGSIYGATVPGQVVFDVIERCVPAGPITCDPSQFTPPNASSWPDTPQDQQCAQGAVCNNHAPSLWSTKRLSTITTQYNTGAGPVRVDSYRLNQSFPSIGDPQLRLDSILRTGFDSSGASIALPPITFTSQLLHNRVPGFNNQPAMAHWRLTNVATDTGSVVAITYSLPECGPGNMPTDQANVTKRCFPVYWTLPYQQDPTLDYFHKYVVTQVDVQDRNGISPTQVTSYSYLGTPAWHFDDNEIIKPKHRTYGQFRGYAQVEVRTGSAPDRRTLKRTTYFRGMDGDTLPNGGRRGMSVANSLGETVPDNNLYAGDVREMQTFEGDGGPQLSTEITDKVTIATTATRSRTGLQPLTANVVDTGKTRGITALAAGGSRSISTTHRYDNTGRVIATTEAGDGVPELCSITRYADNTTSWIRDRVKETISSQQACPAEGTTPSPILSATRTYYDSSTTLGALPGRGLATRTDKAIVNNGGALTFATIGTVGYDPAGRPLSATDALDRTTGTAYTPSDGGLLSRVVTTNPKGQTTTAELEFSRGLTTGAVDVAGRRTDATYDPLGRLTAVWRPGRVKGQVSANVEYAYLVRTDGPLAVTTRTLVDYGTGTNYVTGVNLFDGLGQLRQTQADDISNPNDVQSRVAKDVFYDSHGWAVRSNDRYTTTGRPATTLIQVADSAVDSRTVTTFDGAGRAVRATAYRGLTATWDTRTIHGGDRTTTIPPQGGVTTTTITDVRGKTTELRQYTAPPTVTGSVVSGGAFQTSGYRYTPQGQLDRMTDAAGNVWTYGFDFLGRQTSASDPDSGTRTSTYDLAGQLTSTTDAGGQVLSYEYDPLGRKTAEYSGTPATGTKLASWVYDTAPNGVGKPAHSIRHTPTGNYAVGVSRYDGDGNPAKTFIQVPASETGLAGFHETTTSYTTTGQVRGYTPVFLGGLPAEDVITDYDRHGNPKSTFGYNTYTSASTYTPYGEPSQYTLGVLNSTGWLTYHRDAQTRRVTGVNLSVQQAWPQVDDLRYSYDPAGNITRIVNVQGHPQNGAPTRTQCFNYDPLNRLSQAWTATDNCAAAPSAGNVGGVNPYRTSWEFDPTGLRTRQVHHALPGAAGGDTATSYTYPSPGQGAVRPHALSSTTTSGPAGRSGTSYGYDEVGNTTTRTLSSGAQTLTWTEHNRLATVTTPTGTTSYVYDADGTQLIRRDPGKTTLYLPGQEIVRDTTTGTVTGTRYYTHNGTTVALRVGGANPQYLQSDQHATTQVAVASVGFAATRRTFDPYGNPLGAGQGPWPDQHGFLNKPHNPATGLTDIGARKYDPATGRFISVDPILDPASPQQWNGYGYANNNPTTHADPSGLFCDGCEYAGSGDHHGVGCSADTTGRCRSQEQVQTEWDIKAGRNKDRSKQPSLGGATIPTFDELKKLRPAGRGYHEGPGETYPDAVRDWAVNRCRNFGSVDDEFCAVAASYGLLEPNPEAGMVILLIAIGGIAALAIRACMASTLCPRIVGGALDATAPEGAAFAGATGGSVAAVRMLDHILDTGRATCSFTGDTEVLMADGTHKPISEIKVGDQVLAADPDTGEHGPRTVTAVLAHEDTVLDLATDDGATITTTEDHPYYNATDHQWQQAQDLDPGDQLHTANGSLIKVGGLQASTAYITTAYNLTVNDLHTYYVIAGSTPVLVHNCNTMTAGELVKARTSHGIDQDYIRELDEQLTDDDLLKWLNEPNDGDFALMTRDGALVGGHHRIYLLEQRIKAGRIDPDIQIRFDYTDERHR